MELPFPNKYLVLSLAIFMLANTAYAEKNVTMTLEDDEMMWCYYGSDKKPTAVCNSMELQGKSDLMDAFLYFLEYGPIVDCD